MNINPLKAPENEASIMEHWKYTDKVYISCVCITFNQEGYIRDAINGMLAQVTDYKFEILIHDDLSTDNTRNIIKKYQEKYPNIIKLVLQKENQYSKGKKIIPLAVVEAKGEYIALCEGDDFWVSQHKIDTQIKILYQYQNINMCVHNAYTVNSDNKLINLFRYQVNKDQLVPIIYIYTISGQFSPTASYFFNKKIFLKYIYLYDQFPILDFFIEAILGRNGIFYLKDKMSIYRYDSIGSWSRNELSNTSLSLIRNQRMLSALNILNDAMDNSLKEEIEYKKSDIYKNIAILSFKQKSYKNIFDTIKKIKKTKCKHYFKILLSFIILTLRK